MSPWTWTTACGIMAQMTRVCAWCRSELSATARRDSVFCGRKCRQSAFRVRRRYVRAAPNDGSPLRVAYADPPYPGKAWRYYRTPEVDHVSLLEQLRLFDGWALSTSAAALRELLPLCPPGVRVCPWVKPHSAHPATYGIHNCWEPVIVSPARHLRPGRRDWLSALPARHGGSLPGRKPQAFCAWLFGLLGMLPGDELVDLFPGTGIVSASWRELCREASPVDVATAGRR